VTERDLNLRQANDLEDTLSIDPSVTVGGSTGIAQKIYVRNLGEGLLNVSVDGATQSGALFHHTGRMAIEPELLKQVEIQPGIGDATHGPGALGGAIRFVTKDPDDFLAPDQQAGALVKTGYYSNSDGYKGSLTGFARINENWSTLLSYVYSDHQNMKDADGDTLLGSETQQEVILTKLVGHFGDGHTFRASFENLEEEGQKLRRPEWAAGPGNPEFPMESSRQTVTLGHEYRPETVQWIDLRTNLSYSTADIYQNGPFGPYEGLIKSFQFDLRNLQPVGRHEFEYGMDYRFDKVEAGPSSNPDSVSEDGSVTGLFVQGDFELTEPLTFSAGARADAYRLHDNQGQDFEHEGISPNAGITYRVNPNWSVNASYATAYRGPDINDAFKLDIAQNASDIEAEEAENYEVRITYENQGFTAEGGAYWHTVDNVITTTLPWSNVYDNQGTLKTDGFFARISYATESYNISLQYNHADTELNGQTATRYQYGSIVSQIGNTWVLDAMWTPIEQLDIGWNVRLVEAVDGVEIPPAVAGIPNASINKPGYITNDFYLSWRPEFIDNMTVNFTVKNIFDEDYINHGSIEDLRSIPGFGSVVGAPEPGRDFRISVSLLF